MEQVFCDIIKNLPEGQPLEIPIHPKKIRVLPAMVARNPESEILWSSFETIAPSTSRGHETRPPMPMEANSTVDSVSNITNTAPSPALVLPASVRPLDDTEIANMLNYGSEDESGEEEEGSTPMLGLAASMLVNNSIKPKSRITRWQDTNVTEIYTYLAIVMAMGLVVKSRLEEYWNVAQDIFITPGFAMEMTCDRFQLLSKCLHFRNNNDCDPALLTRPEAKIYKIKPILDHLNNKFSSLYNLSQNIALDESLTMWKGWLDINQFIRNKAATVGIKTYEICESQTGYLWRFEVHAGHDDSALQDDDPISGIVPSLVLRLLNGLEHKGHTIWMDNFYNSPALARELKVLGFDCVGTLRTNRQFVPRELATITKRDMTVGQVLGCTSGDVDLMVWRDKNRVAFISTYHGLAVTRCGDTLKPTVVQDYNVCMGGVDRKDQQLAMYPIERRRTRVWYKKFFRRLVNASILNAHILLNNQLLTHRQFRKSLITDLLRAHRPPTPTPTLTPIIHSPAQYDLIKPRKPDRLKRKCAVCHKRTITYCKACKVPMCIFTCYEPYHTSH
ncbi:unnamed protein product [Arctia plantaginis]|uniref:PiggyBac transposable element-derived protein domain-containing protein n=1 Tax=Arctia plantaginis TaxID=874455 RepID=A0A8S1ASM5_ARCPL|nr:unnamed protein product [Arctia plantaginis]